MKIGILTFTDSQNYGALLQAYALMTTLKKIGGGTQSELINFKRKKLESPVVGQIEAQEKTQYNIVQKIMLKKAKSRRNVCKEKVAAFKKDYLNFGKDYGDDEKLIFDNPPEYDVYVCGSDQIWNPFHKVFSLAYMLIFAPEGKKLVAYAPSFGTKTGIEKSEYYSSMCEAVKNFSYLSCRELSGRDIIRKMGCCKEITWVADPVFLLNKNQWQEIMPKERVTKERYILLYALNEVPDSIMKLIYAFAKDKRLPIVVIPFSYSNALKKAKDAFDAGPIDFLRLIRDAEYVFSNSFHGTAFSIIFDKIVYPFIGSGKDTGAKGERIYDLCHRVGISDNIIDEEATVISEEYAYADQDKVKEMILISKEYLKNAVFD